MVESPVLLICLVSHVGVACALMQDNSVGKERFMGRAGCKRKTAKRQRTRRCERRNGEFLQRLHLGPEDAANAKIRLAAETQGIDAPKAAKAILAEACKREHGNLFSRFVPRKG